MLNILSLISFANAIFFLFISIYSIVFDRKSLINQTSAIECLLLAIWSFSYTFFYVAPSKEEAWFWLKLGSIGWSGFMGTLVWFFLALTRTNRKNYKVLKVIIIVILPIVLILFNFFSPMNSAAVDLVPSTSGLGWTYVNHISNWLYWLYIVYILMGIFICVYLLSKWLMNSKSKKFRRIAIVFLAVDGFLILCGFLLDLIIPLFTKAIPPMTNITLVLFCFSYLIIIFKLDVFKKNTLEASGHILDTIRDALMVLDRDGIILHCNKATAELLQYNINNIIGEKLIKFFKENSYNQKSITQLIEEKKLFHKEVDLVAKDGSIIHAVYSASIAEDDMHGFMGIVISFHDITKQKNLENKLYELAHYDSLTGLPNRRFFIDMLYAFEEIYQNENKDFAIFFMDLDGFKKINDTMGHDMGDKLLIEVGNRINACIDDADIVARIGGDEFVMLQANVKCEEQVNLRKEKILEQFKRKFIISNQHCPIGVSIGCTMYSKTNGIPAMMKEADSYMYLDKLKKRSKSVDSIE